MKSLELTPTVPHLFPQARRALNEPLFSHRSDRFSELFRRTSELLTAMNGGRFHPVIAAGTGTWANELMVWNTLPHASCGLVLINGEFGSRLYNQCLPCRPDTIALEFGWGTPFDPETINACLDKHPEIDWIFAVATETSCGMGNDLEMLDRLCRPRHIRLAVDGVSAIGMAPELFNLSRIAVITASSGKALAALPGISLIFHDPSLEFRPSKTAPDSLNLLRLIAAESSPGMVRNTLGSPQLSCLAASLEELSAMPHYRDMHRGYKQQIIQAFARLGIEALPASNSPMVTTFRRPPEQDWRVLDAKLNRNGIHLYTAPEYLQARGLFQIATMGNITDDDIQHLIATVTEAPPSA
jgi:aspartate aminotransferase-like enzyme